VNDLIYLGVVAAFFVVGELYVRGCAKL